MPLVLSSEIHITRLCVLALISFLSSVFYVYAHPSLRFNAISSAMLLSRFHQALPFLELVSYPGFIPLIFDMSSPSSPFISLYYLKVT